MSNTPDNIAALSNTEKRALLAKLLHEKNQADQPQLHAQCLHHAFEAQTLRTPNASAVICDNTIMTYRTLNARANQLAHHLHAIGVPSGTTVGLCLPPSADAMVGLFGILKAGCAYAACDPDDPQAYVTARLARAGVTTVLSQHGYAAKLPNDALQIITLDGDAANIAQCSKELPEQRSNAKQPALWHDTEKHNALVTHQSIGAYLDWLQQTFPLRHTDVLLQHTPITQLAAVLELFWPLACGARVVICSDTQTTSEWPAFIAAQHISIVQCAPDALSALLEVGNASNTLRLALCCGAGLTQNTVDRFFQQFSCPLHYLYQTPDILGAITTQRCGQNATDAMVPLGRPTYRPVFVLGPHQQPAPIGVKSVIYVGSEEGTDHITDTGDVGCWQPDGRLTWLGHHRRTALTHGYGIDLQAVETALLSHPQLAACHVRVDDAEPSGQLKAYAVRNGVVEQAQLQQHLAMLLPAYMRPITVTFLAHLPVTVDGAIDATALSTTDTPSKRIPPKTPIEQQLAAIWCELLNLASVGVADNFFALGGHSLLASRLLHHIQTSFQVELALSTVFQTPTIAALAQIIAATEQRHQTQAIPRRQETSPAPLSFAQKRLWFIQQLDASNPVYHLTVTVRLTGALQPALLTHSFNAMIQRHDILRTNFRMADDAPVQITTPNRRLNVPIQDLQTLSEQQQSLAIDQQITACSQQPFDLTDGALFRVRLLQLQEQEHLLLLTIHHIICDGWSLGVFMQELSHGYGVPPPSKPQATLPIQYADFTVWQRAQLNQSVLAQLLHYWQQQLADAPPTLALPSDHARQSTPTFAGKNAHFLLDRGLTEQLQALSQTAGATLFMTLLAAFAILLSRYSQQEDLVIGSPIANRRHRDLETLIGFFVNTLALRIDVANNPTFEALLAQVKAMTLAAFAHQDLPFEVLVEALQPKRCLNQNPLVQVAFVLQNTPQSPLSLPGLTIGPLEFPEGVAQLDLTCSLAESADGMRGFITYNTALFDADTITRMIRHFRQLLVSIVAQPQQPIATLPMLCQSERHQLLIEWNDTQTDYPQDVCIHQLFERQAAQHPDAIALDFDGRQLSYGALNARANQLAGYLRTLDVGPEVLVGIYVERALEMMVGLLGILKAGGAYLPLDPEYPTVRINFMLKDAQAPVLLTQSSLQQTLSPVAQTVCLDTDTQMSQFSVENANHHVTPSNLAYVIYTSGSTGEPKGVAIPHQAVNRLVCNTNYTHISRHDNIAQASNVSFDAATFEIWGALLNGATLIGVQKHTVLSPPAFVSFIRAKKISVLCLATALFHQIARDIPSAFQTVREVLFGGEAADPKCIARVLEDGPPQRLVNGYGPTESVTFTSFHVIHKIDSTATAIPIGRPISNTQIYLLDPHLQPCVIGAAGELYIGGAGLARGYLNRPALTAEKFIPHPFSDDPSARLYKTGDLARYCPNGDIEYVGRLDQQVKVRGFRIELGEIEVVLGRHPEVQQIVVLMRQELGEKRLIAYVVANTGTDAHGLRHYLRENLPGYMTPAAFVFLPSLPLTENGKIDRNALPVPTNLCAIPPADLPETETQRQIAQIWQTYLQLEQVGIHDNFFDLGGHSLLLASVHRRLQECFEQPVSMLELFEYPTIYTLAKKLHQAQNAQPKQENCRANCRTARQTRMQQQRQSRQQHRNQQ